MFLDQLLKRPLRSRPGTQAATPAVAPLPPDDVDDIDLRRQVAELTEAVNELRTLASSSQQDAPLASPADAAPVEPRPDVDDELRRLVSLVLDEREARTARTSKRTTPPPRPGAADIGGDLPGGEPVSSVVDYSKLSPVQQIALGLKDSQPSRAPQDRPTTRRSAQQESREHLSAD